jgi:hypothetical protein
MQESSTYPVYLAFVEEGRVEEARRILFRFGERRYGTADEFTRNQIGAIENIERLESLLDCLDKVSNWQELLQTA